MRRFVIGLCLSVVVLAVGQGQALAAHINCGDVLTVDTKLDHDLIDCPENGLIIGADGITLNLASHTIDGTGIGSAGSGVVNTGGFDGVTIKNGRIQEFFNGVLLISAQKNRVLKLTAAANNIAGVALVESESNLVQRNTTSGNFVGIFIADSRNNQVTQNTVSGNNAGLGIGRGERNVLRRNLVSGNNAGMVLSSTIGNEVRRNTVSNHGEDGIMLLEAHQTVVKGNSVSNSARIGIHLNSSGGNRIEENSVVGSASQAILLVLSHETVIAENSVSSSLQGINVTDSFNTVVSENVASGNLLDGIFVNVFSDGAILTENVANANLDDGIQVDNVLTTLARNRANNNGDLGIEAVQGVTDGGGNRASGNGNPAQCTGVACS